jgi:hypothetical protein
VPNMTVNFDDEAIDLLAARIALHMKGLTDPSQSVTPPEQNTRRTQTDQVSSGDGWDSAPSPAQRSEPAREPDVPTCKHGPMRFAAGGYNKNTGKSYGDSYRCEGPRGEWCQTIWLDDRNRRRS